VTGARLELRLKHETNSEMATTAPGWQTDELAEEWIEEEQNDASCVFISVRITGMMANMTSSKQRRATPATKRHIHQAFARVTNFDIRGWDRSRTS
jgi:hypothetical protein